VEGARPWIAPGAYAMGSSMLKVRERPRNERRESGTRCLVRLKNKVILTAKNVPGLLFQIHDSVVGVIARGSDHHCTYGLAGLSGPLSVLTLKL
jgi:hypothetical protein